ncbi:hypothetical protein BLOT_011398 [Blomia tropicalis]|nr:hypothetical protein BLOT_011398 [Blomia tropicalis]
MLNPEHFSTIDFAHNRYNPLTDQWVLVSPHRLQRPWSGQNETESDVEVAEHDPNNPLCPGVRRGNGEMNPIYSSTFTFDNDFPALRETYESKNNDLLLQLNQNIPNYELDKHEDPLFRLNIARGKCRVMCFHPKSNISLPLMSKSEIVTVIDEWILEYNRLASHWKWVQIFENKGAIMGCSNPHPHCQIWASDYLPNEARTEDRTQRDYYQKYGRPMLLDYVEREIKLKDRIVDLNDHWITLIPFWAFWPFETMIIPRRHIKRIAELTDKERESLATIMKQLLIRYDNLFKVSFPYSMGWHGAPTAELHMNEDYSHWQLHASYYPPLLRSATIKKFMVGYELLAQVQRDLTAEKAAEYLREMPLVHYKENK